MISRNLEAGQAGETPNRVQVEPFVPAGPRAPDLVVTIEDHRLDSTLRKRATRREARGSAPDDDHVSTRHRRYPR